MAGKHGSHGLFPVKKISTSLSLGYSRQPQYHDDDKSLYLSVSLPLNSFSNYDNASINSNVITSNSDTLIQTGINGSLLEQRFTSRRLRERISPSLKRIAGTVISFPVPMRSTPGNTSPIWYSQPTTILSGILFSYRPIPACLNCTSLTEKSFFSLRLLMP